MPLIARVKSLWRSLVRRDRLDADLDDELRTYFDEIVDRKIRAGATPSEARRSAIVEMGSITHVRDEVRAARIGVGIETTVHDVRHAWRGLWRTPGFAVVTILTLALGIGANTAIFSVVRAMLIAPLPYRDPSRLVFVWSDMTKAGYPRAPLSAPELKDLRDRSTLFQSFGSIWATTTAVTGEGDPEQLRIGLVSTNFFSAVLGADAALGRTFAPEDETQTAPRTILLGWALFQRRFGGDTSIVGRPIHVNGIPTVVVGVMPADFRLLMPPDAAVPDDLQAWQLLNPQALTRGPRGQQFLRVVGRMKPDVTLDQARREIDGIAKTISKEFTEYGAQGRVFTTVALQADGVRQIRPVLLALFGGVAILLLIACVNVAALLVARAASRTRDTAVRLSLGAGRGRLTRQCVIDGLVLATLGAAAGVLLGRIGLDALLTLRPESLSRLGAARIDPAVLAFTAGTATVWGILFSLAPLAEVLRTDMIGAMQQDGRRAGGSLHYRTRATLVVCQIALSTVMLVSAALMVRTFLHIQRIDPGFRSDRTLSFRISLPGNRYRTREAFNEFGQRLQEALRAAPSVAGVGSVSHLPYDNLPNWGGPYISKPGADESTAVFADHRAVTPGFLETVGARLVDGRFFTGDDGPRGQPVVIVDDQLARRAWPGERAIGKRIAADPASTGHPVFWATVVGVVGHVRHRSLLEDLTDQIYFAERQIQRNPMAFVVRTGGDPAALAGTVRSVVAALDPQLPVYDIRPLDEYVTGARAAQRFATVLAAAFAMVALLLAAVGVYGVIAYAVTRRRYEFGVRLALGAQSRQVTTLVFREGVVLAGAGLVAGLVGAAVAARQIQSQLFGVTPRDAVSYAAAIVAIGATALAASWIPARRASAIAPMEALRAE
jgi:putative ABC transport system permease protein